MGASYRRLLASGELKRRVTTALEALGECRICPRDCGVDRLADDKAVCQTGRHALVASAFPHFGEESCLRGWRGSGTIFFAACNLRCVFCQNFDISWYPKGEPMNGCQVANLMLALQDQGCHNINFVTPEHVVPQVIEAIYLAARRGLELPIVYNTSAYDSLHSIELLEGIVDIYMPDFKYWHAEAAKRQVLAEDYPQQARATIRAMHEQVGDLVLDPSGIARRGLLVRHLVMPGGVAGTPEIMDFLAREISPDTFVNIMDQYHPAGQVRARPRQYVAIDRRPTSAEVRAAFAAARASGLHRFA